MNTNKLWTVSKKSLAAILLFLSIYSPGTWAQQADSSNTVARLIKYEVKPGFEQVFRKVITDYVYYAMNMDSNLLTEAYYEQDRPSLVWLIERWNSKTALDKISSSSQFKAIDSLSVTALLQPAETIYVKDLEPLSKKQWRSTANKNDRPITIMLFVDSKPGTEEAFEKTYHTAMPAFRSEPGVINYQLSRFETDNTKFVTYEKFRSDAAFQYHLGFPPIKPVIDYLNTSIKKQPFRDGLHTLIEFAPLNRQ
ncbi:MAG: antibiotic biosynthesis monooxygenase family protein [Ferruginibacter sp.]